MKIPLFKIYNNIKDTEAVDEIIKSGMGWAIGSKVEEFETALAKYISVKYALVFNSGTSALHALMLSYGFGCGDEVIVPSFSFVATANAPVFVGAKPVFAEIEDKTLGIDPDDLERRITQKTKAIIVVHYGGLPCRIEEIKKIAKKHNLVLIEDTAEAMGAEANGKKAGSFGDASALSFCQNKIITTGEGGAALTNSKEIYEKLKLIRSHGRLEGQDYFSSSLCADYVALGYNFRMSNILAGLGISQLEKIKKIIAKRRTNAEYLNKKLVELKNITTPRVAENVFIVYQLYTIKVNAGREIRDALKKYLNSKGIMAKVYFDPIHLTDFYKRAYGFKKGDLPITERLSEQVLTLPMYPDLTKQEMDYIAKNIKYFFK